MASTMRSAVPHRCAQRPLQGGRRTPLVVRALKAGDTLPFFELKDDTGKLVKSTDLVQDSGAVIFVYPKAGTSGCTVQACGFRDNYEYFAGKGYKIVGMSADLPAEQAKWKAENRFNYPLLSDPAYDALSALGVAKPAKDGVNRSHIIVERGGKVKDVRISIGSKESVPEAIKAVA